MPRSAKSQEKVSRAAIRILNQVSSSSDSVLGILTDLSTSANSSELVLLSRAKRIIESTRGASDAVPAEE